MNEALPNIARITREACRRAAIEAYEDALIRGLCAQGAFEAAMGAIQSLDLAPLLEQQADGVKVATPPPDVKIKRVYEPATDDDGKRVLVDRLWPRGVSRERARLDAWVKDAGPSQQLRKWFDHDPARWEEFQRRYHRELNRNPHVLDEIRALLRDHRVTLVYGARDEAMNNAAALKAYLMGAVAG